MVKKSIGNTVMELKDVFSKGHGLRFIGADLDESRDCAIVKYVTLYRLYGKTFDLGHGVTVDIDYGLCSEGAVAGYEIRFPMMFGDTCAGNVTDIQTDGKWVKVHTDTGVEYGTVYSETDKTVFIDEIINNDME